jgi:lysophospholipase L1-like esterase
MSSLLSSLTEKTTPDGTENIYLDDNGTDKRINPKNLCKLYVGGDNLRAHKGVLVQIGDSNTNGRAGWRAAYEAEWLASGEIFHGWTSYNLGQNGSILADWATTEIANVDNPTYSDLPPADYNGTDPGAGALARAINADPDVIILSLGTNDLNSVGGQAGIGTIENLRTNLALLVNFLLERTRATIILRMPQPLAYGLTYQKTCGITNGSKVVTMASTTGLEVGMFVSGTGVVPNSAIQFIDSGTQIRIADNASATNASAALIISTDTFAYSTQFANSAAAEEVSSRLKTVYREWRGAASRVLVYDSQTLLFGDSVDDWRANGEAQDPILGNGYPLVYDGLHPSDLGYRRIAQQIAEMVNPAAPRIATISVRHSDLARYSTWSTTLKCRSSAFGAVTSGILAFELPPEAVALESEMSTNFGPTGAPLSPVGLTGKGFLSRIDQIKQALKFSKSSGYLELMNVPDKTDLYAFNHANGTIYQLTNLTVSQIVTAGSIYPYVELSFTSGSSMSGLGGGLVTFFTKKTTNIPFRTKSVLRVNMLTGSQMVLGGSPDSSTFVINSGKVMRNGAGGTPTISFYLANLAGLGYNGIYSGYVTVGAPGFLIGTVTHTAWTSQAYLVFDPTNFPSGGCEVGPTDLIVATITSGSITDYNSNAAITLTD